MMTIYLGWLIEYKIIFQVSVGEINFEEYMLGIEEVGRLAKLNSSNNDVHMIMDVGKLKKLPPLRALTVEIERLPNSWLIYCNMNSGLMKMLTTISTQLMRVPARIANDYTEAFTVLQKIDHTLRDTSIPDFKNIQWIEQIEGETITRITRLPQL